MFISWMATYDQRSGAFYIAIEYIRLVFFQIFWSLLNYLSTYYRGKKEKEGVSHSLEPNFHCAEIRKELLDHCISLRLYTMLPNAKALSSICVCSILWIYKTMLIWLSHTDGSDSCYHSNCIIAAYISTQMWKQNASYIKSSLTIASFFVWAPLFRNKSEKSPIYCLQHRIMFPPALIWSCQVTDVCNDITSKLIDKQTIPILSFLVSTESHILIMMHE